MFLYYPVLLVMALIFYLFLSRKFSLTRTGIVIIVFWVFLLSAAFPGFLSFLSLQYSLFLLFFLAFSGGILSYQRVVKEKPEFRRARGARRPQQKLDSSPALKKEPPLVEEKKDLVEDEGRAVLIQRDLEVSDGRKEALLMDTKEIVHDIIERAFLAKDSGDENRAIQLFQTVLKKSEDISMKGIILSEMISLHKKQGTYLEGARAIDDFLKREKDLRPSLEEHFRSLASYLRRLDELLIKAQCPGIPYNQVSAVIRTRAESMLKENHNL